MKRFSRWFAAMALTCALGLSGAPVRAQMETVLYSFTGGADGGDPYDAGSLLMDTQGNLYGTTFGGGSSAHNSLGGNGNGVVFMVAPSGNETVLYTFTGGADGGNPWGDVIMDTNCNLYGTTYTGGDDNNGVVFELSPPSNGSSTWTETVLYTFTGGADGGNPYAGVIMDKNGNLYGTTSDGGVAERGSGVVFKLSPPYGQNNYSVLYSFTGGTDGSAPGTGHLLMDAQNNLYGTTQIGGNTSIYSFGAGVVFKLSPPYGQNNETVLYAFIGGADGFLPESDVVMDGADPPNLYGTTQSGGDLNVNGDFGPGAGVVFKLSYPYGQNNETVLYAFTGQNDGYGTDGGDPWAGLILDAQGNLYGTTLLGGDIIQNGGYGYGVVFKVTPSGNETVLNTFTGGSDGGKPYGGLIMDTNCNLYGTTFFGGNTNYQLPGYPPGAGVVYKISNATANLSGISVDPISVVGGVSSTGTVTLNSPAPAEGLVVDLSSSNTVVVQVPANVTVLAGQLTAMFTATTTPVSTNTTVTISATSGNTVTTPLTVDAPAPASLSANPNPVVGGDCSTGTLTLSGPAPAGGLVVSLTSSNPAVAQVSDAVIVPANQTSTTFPISTASVESNTTVIITASANGSNMSTTLTVAAPSLMSLLLDPTIVTGGNSSIGIVMLDAPAPSGGFVVSLMSSDPSVAQVPESGTVTVPAGETSAPFTITTSKVTTDKTATISASANGSPQTAMLTVTNLALKSVTVKSTTGGMTTMGTVTLTETAPAGGVVVTLTSSDPTVASFPEGSTVTVPGGQKNMTFTVTTSKVSSNTKVTIFATYSGTTKTATLTVKK